MIQIILASLVLLTPVSGVVSGGREVSFAMKTGLIPASEWLHVAGLPTLDRGTFTEMSLWNGHSKSFRVVSSGDTAGLDPLIASRVDENGFAAQILLEGFSIYSLKNDDTGNCVLSYGDAILDFRGSSYRDLTVSGEYSSKQMLLAANANSAAAGVSFSLGESVTLGPAFSIDESGQSLWFMSKAEYGPIQVHAAPAIDGERSYRRLYGACEFEETELIFGWDGEEYYSDFSFRGRGFLFTLSLSSPGALAAYSPSNSLILLVSHRQEGWFQGEIQGKYKSLSAGVDFLRTPGGPYQFGIGLGIDIGNNNLYEFPFLDSPWTEQYAVTSLL